MFQSIQRYFKRVSNTNNHVLEWKSKGFPDEIIELPSTSPLLNSAGTRIRVEFKRSCLKQGKISFNHGKIVNIIFILFVR